MNWEGVNIRLLPFKPKPMFYDMRKQKIEVPPRDERIEQIGDPKAPRMGSITPTSVELPEVDDLLKKMERIGPKTRKELLSIPMPAGVDFGELWTKEDLNFKFFISDFVQREYSVNGSDCTINCPCGPCRSGNCFGCTINYQIP